jgi:trigger factor
LKINKFSRKGNLVNLQVEDDYSAVESKAEESFQELVRNVKIPGFRPGKAPRDVFEKYIGAEAIIERAAEKAMNELYGRAIVDKKLEPVDFPKAVKIEQMDKGKPFIFSLEVEVKPEVKLGHYKGVRVTHKDLEIKEEEVNNYLERLRENYAEYSLATGRPVANDDIVTLSIMASSGGKPLAFWTKDVAGIKVGGANISKEFDDQITGMNLNDNKEFSINFPVDFKIKEVAGAEVKFKVNIKEIREKKLPALDDALVQKVSEFKTLVDFKNDLKKKMTEEATKKSDDELREEVVKEVVKTSTIEIPEAMVQRETDRMVRRLEESLKSSKLTFEDYLKFSQKDMAGLRLEFKDPATQRVMTDLTLEAIAKEEKIEVKDEDIDEEIKKIALDNGKPVDEIKQGMRPDVIDYIKYYLKDKKTIDFLVAKAKIKH